MTKSIDEQVSDFVDRWSDANAGRFEFVLNDGQRVVAQECYLIRDQADRPDRICVNHDSPSFPNADFDPLDVVAINDLEQQCPVVDVSIRPPSA